MQQLILPARGLFNNNSELTAPEGSLSIADNVVIDRDNVITPRRGYGRLPKELGGLANKLFVYQNKLICNYSTGLMAYYYENQWFDYTGGPYAVDYAGTKVRAAQSNRNFYFTSRYGIYKLDAYNSNPILAGAYKGLDVSLELSSNGAWLEKDNYTAYRVLWGYKDKNNNVILGAVSQRAQIKNTTSASKSVTVKTAIPTGVTASWFIQVYRSASSTATPNDEMGLVYETNPTATQISNKLFEFEDITDDDLRGATIYTAASQEGLAASNEQPPLAKDIAVYRDHMFYANVASKQRYNLSLLSVGGTNGLKVGDTITVGGLVYTAGKFENISTRTFRAYNYSGSSSNLATDSATNIIGVNDHGFQNGDPVTFSGTWLPAGITVGTTYYVISATQNSFKVSLAKDGTEVDITSSGSGIKYYDIILNLSASQKIENTALSLIRTINQNSASTTYAYYTSIPDNLPGKILLEARSLDESSFAVNSSNANCWSPDLPSSGSAESSTNDSYKNGVFFSKPQQPEAVPLSQFFFVGSQDQEILRIVPLRDSLFVLKQDGIYRISGEDSSSFRVDLFDSTTRVIAPESAVVLNNQVWALTDQGVVSITEAGVQVRSRAIESTLLELTGMALDKVKSLTFAVGYETDRKFILFTIKNAGDSYPTQAFVYNVFTNAWTKWNLSKTCGIVNTADDRLYFGDAESNYVNQERKSFNSADQVDYGFATAIAAQSQGTFTFDSQNVDLETSSIQILNHGRPDGDLVNISSTGGVPGGLSISKTYYVVGSTQNSFQLSETIGGTPVTLLTGGSGTHTITYSSVGPAGTTTVYVTGSDSMAVGDVLYQSDTVFASIVAISTINGTVTVRYAAGFAPTSATLLKAITTAVAWVPLTIGNPGFRKQFREVGLLFKRDFIGTGSVFFSSDESADQEEEQIQGTDFGNWGLFAWGGVPWGGEAERRPFRIMVPRNKQRCTQLTVEFRHSVGYGDYQLNGLSVIAQPGSERFRRA